jgi:hypothetical protein
MASDAKRGIAGIPVWRKWLGRRDSNPTYLIQSQAFYR